MAEPATDTTTITSPAPPQAPTVAPATPPVAPQPSPEATSTPPAPLPHDPFLVRQAQELQIPEEFIRDSDPASLQRTVYLMTRERLAAATRQQPAAPVPPPAPQPEPEFRFEPEIETEIAELTPGLQKAFRMMGKKAAAADQVQVQVREMTAQQSQREFAQVVQAEIAKLPGMGVGIVQAGTPEALRREAVMAALVHLSNAGAINNNVPPHIAVPLAYKAVFGGAAPAAAPASPPAPPPPPAPTTTARPTHRTSNDLDNMIPPNRDDLIEMYRLFQAKQREEARAAGQDKGFTP